MIRNQALVTVTGWLNDPKTFDWGSAAKVSVDVRKQNDLGEWETLDKVVYDVISDNPFPDVQQVTVTGRITGLTVFQKRDGTTGVSVKVRADTVIAAEENDAPF
jgi:hypothetical protein